MHTLSVARGSPGQCSGVCIAKGPADWIESWTFDELGFFDEVDLAESVVPEPDLLQFEIRAYAFWDERFADGIPEPCTILTLACKAPGSDFEPLGYDVVSKSITDFFECSPFACRCCGAGAQRRVEPDGARMSAADFRVLAYHLCVREAAKRLSLGFGGRAQA